MVILTNRILLEIIKSHTPTCSSSVIGLGFAFAFVTNPDFLTTEAAATGFFLFFSADEGSFLLGLLAGLLYNKRNDA